MGECYSGELVEDEDRNVRTVPHVIGSFSVIQLIGQ